MKMKRLTENISDAEIEIEQNKDNECKRLRLADELPLSDRMVTNNAGVGQINSVEQSNSHAETVDGTYNSVISETRNSLESPEATNCISNTENHEESELFILPSTSSEQVTDVKIVINPNTGNQPDSPDHITSSQSTQNHQASKEMIQLHQHSSEEILLNGSNTPESDSSSNWEKLPTSLLSVTFLEGHADTILCVVADKNIILSASRDTTVRVWNANAKEEICSFRGHTDSVNAVALLTQEQTTALTSKLGWQTVVRIAVSGSLDCSIRLWSLPEGVELSSIYTYNGIICLAYLEAEFCIVTGTGEGLPKAVLQLNRNAIPIIDVSELLNQNAVSLHDVYESLNGGKLELWDIITCKSVHSVFAHEDGISDIQVEGCYIYTASVDGMVKVWMREERELQLLYTRKRKNMQVNDMMLFNPCKWKAVTSHRNTLYLGDDNSTSIKILDWRAGKLKMLRNQVQTPGAIDAICSKDCILLSSMYDFSSCTGGINVWQLPEMKYICTMAGDVSRIFSLAISETENGMPRVISAGSQLVVWDYNCSHPPSDLSKDSFYCVMLEQLGNDIPYEKSENTMQFVQQKINRNETHLVNVKDKSWWCNLL